VHHRAVVLNSQDPEIPKSARIAPNGEMFTKLLQVDFNSLYPYAFRGDLPTGPGIKLIRKKDQFYLKSLDHSQNKCSLESLQWLSYMQNSSGLNIKHAYNKGEHKIGPYFLDGYALDGDFKIGYDYNGCRNRS